ncbi:hypothetical protein, partial [Saccharopolyspora erythraea]|uniref:hypothetical protein n=1 Tax=Saccharopolyspora erythraea TaxID=1836 RepID=UPI001EE66880
MLRLVTSARFPGCSQRRPAVDHPRGVVPPEAAEQNTAGKPPVVARLVRRAQRQRRLADTGEPGDRRDEDVPGGSRGP